MSDTTDAALDYLHGLTLHGVKLGLGNIRALLAAAGNPQDTYPTIHVGGTNGKGSTVAMLHAMLCAAGYRVGRFTSPHLITLNERFQINGVAIGDEELREEIDFFRALADKRDYPPTFFELNTAIAFRWFARKKVELALIEVGLGGRLDSTNVIKPILTAVTNIDLEHTQYLGDTLEEIAYEKAGIFKHGVPAVIGETRPGPRSVLLLRARQERAPQVVLGREFQFHLSGPALDQCIAYESPTLSLSPTPLALNGAYQGENAAMAIAMAECISERFPKITRDMIVRGLAEAVWPCRLERVLQEPEVYIDVAHNPAGAKRLAEVFTRCVILLGVSSDKDAAQIMKHLGPIAERFVITAYAGTRAMEVGPLADAARTYAPVETTQDVREALRIALPLVRPGVPLLITGSIYLAGEARAHLISDYGASRLAF